MASNQQLCIVSLDVLIKMKLVFLGLTIVSVVGFKLVVSISEDEISAFKQKFQNVNTVHKDNDVVLLEENNNSSVFSIPVSDQKYFRLSSNVIPSHYELEVFHILDDNELMELPKTWSNKGLRNFSSPGKVWIDINVLEGVTNITLHAEDMEINQVKLCSKTSSNCTVEDMEYNIEIKEVKRDADVNFLILILNKELEPGTYRLYIQFVSRIADDRLNGLYLDYYMDSNNKQKRYLATTLFAPNHARKAFPCFDEPGMRATFAIKIGHRAGKYFSLSNMELISTEPIIDLPNYVWDTFQRTPSMSTYIVAMITCDFSMRQSFYAKKDGTNTTIMTYVPGYLMNYKDSSSYSTHSNGIGLLSHNLNSSWPTDFSQLMTEKVMPEFGSIFNEEFPLKNLKTISLPHFFFSAMENWGLMTFKDPVLIDIQNVTTESERFKIANVVGHELSHQWFGNLVGLKFWSYVWLKEGFSTFFSYYATELVYPQLYPWVHFTTEALQVGLDYDESLESHPLENVPKTSAAIGEIYTDIPYKKGASILRMTEKFMKHSNFMNGIRIYVDEMKYKAAGQDDLFESLQKAENKAQIHSEAMNRGVIIKEILDTWTKQSGFPIVKVDVEEDKKILRLRQEKFLNPYVKQVKNSENISSVDSAEEDASWWIPITLWPKISSIDNNNSRDLCSTFTDLWIPKNEQEIFVDYKHTQELFLINADAIGYYRVLYDSPKIFDRIYNQLMTNHTALKAVFRSQFFDDYFSFAFADYVPVETVLNLTRYLDKETSFVVWKSVLNNLKKVNEKLGDTEYFPYLKKYMIKKLVPAWKLSQHQLKDLQDITEKTRLHSLLQEAVCNYDPTICIEIAQDYYKLWKLDSTFNPIPADEQETIYCAMMVTTPTSELNETWRFFEELYANESYSVQKFRYFKAFSCVNDTDMLQRFLNWTLESTRDLHDVDKVQLLKYVAQNPKGKYILLKFLDENFNTLYKNVSAANPVIEGLKALVPYFNTQKDQKKLEDFILKFSTELGSKRKNLEKEIQKVKLNLLWMESFATKIKSWAEAEMESKSSYMAVLL